MVTPFYASFLSLLLVGLSLNVIRTRRRLRIAIGDDNNNEMQRRIRIHANFIEYTPLFLILLWFAESGGFVVGFVHAYGCLFVAGRVLHVLSLKDEKYEAGRIISGGRYRVSAMICTFFCLVSLAAVLIVQTLMGWFPNSFF